MPVWVTNNFKAAVDAVHLGAFLAVQESAEGLLNMYYDALGNGEAGLRMDTNAMANSFYIAMRGYRGRFTYSNQEALSHEDYLGGTQTHENILDLLPDTAYTEEGYKQLLMAPVSEEGDIQHPTAAISSSLATTTYWELGHNNILSGRRRLRRPFLRRMASEYFDNANSKEEDEEGGEGMPGIFAKHINQQLRRLPPGKYK